MKKNNKGFTLVEVIAVVVIIALLAGISIPLVSKYLNDGKETFNKNLEKELLVAANSYLSDNPKQRPLGRNATDFSRVVYLTDLESKNYLNDTLKDADGGECSNSFVSYNYDGKDVQSLACLKCDNYQTESQVCDSIVTDRDECKKFTVDYALNGVVEYNGELYNMDDLPTGWTNKNITYTFTPVSDNQSGTNVDFTYIVVNGHRIKLDSSYTFKEKQKELLVKVYDNCGNSTTISKKSDTDSDYYIKIDKGSPEAKIETDSKINIDYDKTSVDSSASINFKDSVSGLDYFVFKYSTVNSWDFTDAKEVKLNGEYDVTSNVKNTFTGVGVYYLNVRVYDKAGNSYTTSQTINVTKKTKEYSVFYNGCGGTMSENLKAGQVKYAEIPLVLFADVPSKTDYNFLGWSLESCNSSNVSYGALGSYDIDGDNTLYAIWQKEKTEEFTITYITNSGTNISSQTKSKGESVTLSSIIPTKDYYKFVKWIGSDGKEYNPGDTYTKDDNLVLTASYEGNKITINYYADGGTKNNSNTTISNNLIYYKNNNNFHWFNYGDDRQRNLWNYNGSAINIVKKGYVAVAGKEWKNMSTSGTYAGKTYNQNEDDKNISYSDYCDAKNGDCVAKLQINWTPKVLGVNYNCDGTIKSESYTYGKNSKSNVTCSKYGYVLSGWSYNGTKIKDTNFVADNDFIEKYYNNGKAITLYPVYTAKEITFVYKTDVKEIKEESFKFGTEVTVAKEGVVSKETESFGTSRGYTFMGWRLANNQKAKVNGEEELYFLGSDGQWRVKSAFSSGYQYKILANKCFSDVDCVTDTITLNATFFNNINNVTKIYFDAVWAKFDFDTAGCGCSGCSKITGNVYSIYGGVNWDIYTKAGGETSWTKTPSNIRMPFDNGIEVENFNFSSSRTIERYQSKNKSIKAQACLSQNAHKCINYNSSYLYSKNNSGLCSSSGGGSSTSSGCGNVVLSCFANSCTVYSKSNNKNYQVESADFKTSNPSIAAKSGSAQPLAGGFGQKFEWKKSGSITVTVSATLANGEGCTKSTEFSK